MSDRPTCETCASYCRGHCRRHAPRPAKPTTDLRCDEAWWPRVQGGHDWCGEYVPADFMEPDPVDTTPPTLGRPKI